jgi:hypothetical protein
MNKEPHSLLVGIDFSRGDDVGVLIVGERVNGNLKIINAFQGQEAIDIYNKLVGDKPHGD